MFGEQLGPGRSSRAMAIVHIAIADAVASIRGGYRRYTNDPERARRLVGGHRDRDGAPTARW